MKSGIGSHQSARMGKEEWLTPRYITEAVGEFDLDPCHLENRPWDTAKRHYTKKEDGLTQCWEGRVWCNPPYGKKTSQWLRKLSDHNNGIALIFARTETKMFHEYVWQKATAVFFFHGRLHFHYPNGNRAKSNAGGPSVLIAYGDDNAEALRESGLPGHYQRLR